MRGDYAKARAAFEESVNRAREAGDRYGMGMPLSNLGIMAYQQGDLSRGKELLEESLAIGREAHDPTLKSWSMAELGHIARLQGDFALATELYKAVLESSRVTGYLTGVADMTRALGDVAVKLDEFQKARTLIQEGLSLFQSQGDIRNVVYCLNSFASLAGAMSNWSLAVKLLGVVESQLKGMGIFMSPVDRSVFDQVINEAQRSLGKSEFDKLWAEGESISIPDAVALVVNDDWRAESKS